MNNQNGYLNFFLNNSRGVITNMKILVKQNSIQRKKIYHSYKDDFILLKFNKKKRINKSKYIEILDIIIEYIQQVKTINIVDMYFDARKNNYIKRLQVLQNEVVKDRNYKEYLPNIMRAHTSLFRYAKDNNLKYFVPEKGINLMMLLIGYYG